MTKLEPKIGDYVDTRDKRRLLIAEVLGLNRVKLTTGDVVYIGGPTVDGPIPTSKVWKQK